MSLLSTLVEFVGFGLIVYGLALIALPLGLVAAGVLAVTLGVALGGVRR